VTKTRPDAPKLEDLHAGASVVSRDGHKVGTLRRFVVRKDDLVLTHVVVDTGIFRSGDWNGAIGLSHDRLLPLGAISSASADEVKITMTGDEFKELAVDYIDERFASIEDDEPGRVDLSDLRRFATSIPGEPGPYVLVEKSAMPADEFEIRKDSPVWRLKPHQKIGEVEDVIFDEGSRRVSGLVVRRGLVFSKDVVLPTERIVEVIADIVRVDMSDDELEALVEHRDSEK